MKNQAERIEAASATRLLTSLGLAIVEARHSRMSIKSQDVTQMSQPEEYYTERLQFLDREIEYLETMQERVRTKLIEEISTG